MQSNIYNYVIHAFNKKFYCKISTCRKYNSNIISATLSFGVNNTYCVVIAIDDITKQFGYLAEVQYNKLCITDGTLERKIGTYQFVSVCLYTVTYLFPNIKILNLKDDSYFDCINNGKHYKTSLSHDYIIKYNQTYYEKNFNAKLPKDIYDIYRESLDILDSEIIPLDILKIKLKNIKNNKNNKNNKKKNISYLEKYKDTYANAKTPREFINMLRNKYGEQYCFEVRLWLISYLELLGIDTYKDNWYIDPYNFKKPSDYTIYRTNNISRGGKNITIKKQNKKKYKHTIKHTKK